MIKQAIIPLAGLGTRLLPLTSVYAKELLPINGKIGLEYILDECIDAGITEIIFIISKFFSMRIFYFKPITIKIIKSINVGIFHSTKNIEARPSKVQRKVK